MPAEQHGEVGSAVVLVQFVASGSGPSFAESTQTEGPANAA
jgi:hypothetical protein